MKSLPSDFPLPIEWYLCVRKDDYLALCRKLNVESPPPYTLGASMCTHSFDNAGKLIVIVTLTEEASVTMAQMISLFAHESVHVAQALFRQIGEKTPSEEFQAYITQWVLQTLLYEYEAQIKKLAR